MKILVLLAALVVASPAMATFITGGSDYLSGLDNELLGPGVTFNIGGNLNNTVDTTFDLTYLGSEAGFSNNFNFGGSTIFNNKTASVGDMATVGSLTGLLDFEYFSVNTGSGVSNGANFPINSFQSFAILSDYTHLGVMYDRIVFFDDSGAGPDEDYDDMIVGFNAVEEVPSPGSLALMGIGLFGMGLRKLKG
jgi:hypothetical protein